MRGGRWLFLIHRHPALYSVLHQLAERLRGLVVDDIKRQRACFEDCFDLHNASFPSFLYDT